MEAISSVGGAKSELANEAGRNAESLLLRIPDAARLLGIGRTTLYRLIDEGDIRVLHIGRAARVPVAELHEFVERQRHGDVVR